jgi:hypothetical protein
MEEDISKETSKRGRIEEALKQHFVHFPAVCVENVI